MGTRTEGTKNRETLKYKERNSRERTNGVTTGVLDGNLHRFQEQRQLMKENFLPCLTQAKTYYTITRQLHLAKDGSDKSRLKCYSVISKKR